MADIEKMAIQRDRGYLVKLVVFLLLGLLGGGFVFSILTGSSFSGCVADTFVSPEQTKTE